MPIVVIIVTGAILYGLYDIVYGKLWSKGLEGKLSISTSTVFEGDEAVVTETVLNEKLMPLPWIWVKFQVDRSIMFEDIEGKNITDNYYRNDLFYIMGNQKIRRNLKCICTKRGYYNIQSLDIIGCNMFFTNRMSVQYHSGEGITVYPRLIENIDIDGIYSRITGEVRKRQFINPDPFEFAGIREYQPYDSFKSINFNASAKSDELMVNVNTPTMQREIWLVLNIESTDIRTDAELWEESIRLTATIATHYIEGGYAVGVVTNGIDIISKEEITVPMGMGESTLYRIYDAMARLDLKQNTEGMGSSLLQRISNNQGAMVVIISSYFEEDLMDKYNELEEKGYGRCLIVPVMYYDIHRININAENSMIWRVEQNDSKAKNIGVLAV